MNKHAFEVLEFDKILEIISSYAFSDIGKKYIINLAPYSDYEKIIDEHKKVDEIRKVFESSKDLPLDGLSDIMPALKEARIANKILEPIQLQNIALFLTVARNVKEFIRNRRNEMPTCYNVSERLITLREIEKEIYSTIGPDGNVRDNASPDLKHLRAEIRIKETRILEKLEHLKKDLDLKNHLQEDFITQRNGRYVIPVKIQCRGYIRGIIHAKSNSGETVFIEPEHIIDDSNELAELKLMESLEIEKILRELTNHIRREIELIELDYELLSYFDGLYGIANFASKYSLSSPVITEGNELTINEGKHPLLMIKLGDRCKPLDLKLKEEEKVLLISGPNAGGKTIALKTLGLLTLLSQAGIPIPSKETSVFPVFRNVYADIGDQQNIFDGISTYTSHLKRIIEILEAPQEKSLILLDELGTATDPSEGAPLSQAILEEMMSRNYLIIATSHLPALKAWAHITEAVRNASFSLDEKTNLPTFKLNMDMPGVSDALTVAKNLGLNPEIVDKAKTLMGGYEEQMRDLILSLQEKIRIIDEEAKGLEDKIKNNDELKNIYEERSTQLDREKKEFKLNLLNRKEEIIKEFRSEIERMLRELNTKEKMEKARIDLEELKQEMRKEKEELQLALVPYELGQELTEGMIIRAKNVPGAGIIRNIDREKRKVTVVYRDVEFSVDVEDIQEIEATEKVNDSLYNESKIKRLFRKNVSEVIDLHGYRVEDALNIVDKYLDDAILSGHNEVKIIHGFGQGKLRDALIEFLKTHRQVKEFRPADVLRGGEGTMIVTLI